MTVVLIIYGVFCLLIEAYFIAIEQEKPPDYNREVWLRWCEVSPNTELTPWAENWIL